MLTPVRQRADVMSASSPGRSAIRRVSSFACRITQARMETNSKPMDSFSFGWLGEWADKLQPTKTPAFGINNSNHPRPQHSHRPRQLQIFYQRSRGYFQRYPRPAPQRFAYRQQHSPGAFVEQGAEFQEFSALPVYTTDECGNGQREPRPASSFRIPLGDRTGFFPVPHRQS